MVRTIALAGLLGLALAGGCYTKTFVVTIIDREILCEFRASEELVITDPQFFEIEHPPDIEPGGLVFEDPYASRRDRFVRNAAGDDSPSVSSSADFGCGDSPVYEEVIELKGPDVSLFHLRPHVFQVVGDMRPFRETLVARHGGTKATERAVGAALNWLARHQHSDGHWSFDHRPRCKDRSCTKPGTSLADAAATGASLLPFLAAGQTHRSKGPYQRNITGGIAFLRKRQTPEGDYSGEGDLRAHGLATIAMCEAYALTQDVELRDSARAAVRFIETSQAAAPGQWWQQLNQHNGDTSVVAWQVLALKTAQWADVRPSNRVLASGTAWLMVMGRDEYSYHQVYDPLGPAPNATAVGLLAAQYRGAPQDDEYVREGVRQCLRRLPSAEQPNYYAWFFASQALHNLRSAQWDNWNREMRRALVKIQDKNGCGTGSFPPTHDPYGVEGGRLFATVQAALTLEVYYRHLPLYEIDRKRELDKLPED